MWVTKALNGDREQAQLFLAFGRGLDPGEIPNRTAHAPAGSLWAGLMRLAALIVGQTSASFHYFHGLWRSDMNSVIYIIIKTRFDIDLTPL